MLEALEIYWEIGCEKWTNSRSQFCLLGAKLDRPFDSPRWVPLIRPVLALISQFFQIRPVADQFGSQINNE
jgi:hypothetical protein